MKKIYSYAKKKKCSYINVHVFTSEESLFTHEEKNVCSCIKVHVFNCVKSSFTREEKSIFSCINVGVFTGEYFFFREDKSISSCMNVLVLGYRPAHCRGVFVYVSLGSKKKEYEVEAIDKNSFIAKVQFVSRL